MATEAPPVKRGTGMQFSLFGMPVKVPVSGIVGAIVIAWLWTPTFASETSSGLLTAAVFAVALYLCILIHELAHGFSARALGNRVHGITLWILGGYTVYERSKVTPGRETIIAISGPLTTLALAGLAQLGAGLIGAGWPMATDLLAALAFTNLLLGVMNLLPGLPLDGGGVLKGIVWGLSGSEYRGTVAAAWGGRVIAIIVVLLPLVLGLLPGSTLSVQLVIVAAIFGVFTWTGATGALRQAQFERRIPALAAASLARRAIPAQATESLAMAMARADRAQAGALVVVDANGQPTGIVNPAAALATPVERRAWVPVASVSRTIDASQAIGMHLSGQALVSALQELRSEELLVVDDAGAIFGVLFLDDVEASLAG